MRNDLWSIDDLAMVFVEAALVDLEKCCGARLTEGPSQNSTPQVTSSDGGRTADYGKTELSTVNERYT